MNPKALSLSEEDMLNYEDVIAELMDWMDLKVCNTVTKSNHSKKSCELGIAYTELISKLYHCKVSLYRKDLHEVNEASVEYVVSLSIQGPPSGAPLEIAQIVQSYSRPPVSSDMDILWVDLHKQLCSKRDFIRSLYLWTQKIRDIIGDFDDHAWLTPSVRSVFETWLNKHSPYRILWTGVHDLNPTCTAHLSLGGCSELENFAFRVCLGLHAEDVYYVSFFAQGVTSHQSYNRVSGSELTVDWLDSNFRLFTEEFVEKTQYNEDRDRRAAEAAQRQRTVLTDYLTKP